MICPMAREKKETTGTASEAWDGGQPILRAEHLTYEYGTGTPFVHRALKDVSFSVYAGRITGIIGHTGSGKSTLVQLLNGLLTPKEGKVYFKGEDIGTDPKKLHELRFHVGLVFQYPEYQLFEETVAKDIAFGPRNMGLSEEEITARVNHAASLVGLDGAVLERSPFDLSGGQKRRAAIAGVLAMTPQVLILDEPASGLDPVGRATVFGALLRYRDDTGAAVVIISHSMEDMARYGEDLLVLSGGRMLAQGTRDEIFCRPDLLMQNGLDVPPVAHLAGRLRQAGVSLPEGLYTVDALRDALAARKGGVTLDP